MQLQIPINHPVSFLQNKRNQIGVIIAFGVGFLMGYVAFIVGVVAALHGMRSSIQMLLYRRKFLRLLKRLSAHSRNSSFVVQAKVVCRKKVVDPITDHRRYKVVLEYCVNEKDESSQLAMHSNDLPFASAAAYDDAPHEGGMVTLHLIKGKPIPTVLYQDKLWDLAIWAKYVDPMIALIGLPSYLFLAWMYSQLASTTTQGSAIGLIMSILSLVLMTPYVVLEVRARHEERIDQLTKKPIETVTEFDNLRSAWQSPGSTSTQKIYPVLSASGIVIMAVFCDAGVIPGCWAAWTLAKWTDLKITRQRQSLVQSFWRAKKVHGYLVDCHVSGFWQQQSSTVTLQYVAPTGQMIVKKLNNGQMLQKYLRHQHAGGSESAGSKKVPIDVLVLTDHQASGFPEDEISEIWSLCKDQIVSLICLLLYLLWFLIQYDDWLLLYIETSNDWLDIFVNDVCLFWTPAWVGIILMMPQAYAHHRIRYRKFLADVFEAGVTVDTI